MTLLPEIATEVLAHSTDAVVLVDAQGKILFVNKQAERLFDYAADDLVGRDVEILMPAASRDAHTRHREGYSETPHSRPLVSGLRFKAMRKSGEVFEAEIALTPIETDQGLIVSTTIRDKSSDTASDAYFRNLLEMAPDAMIIVDEDGRIVIVNGQAEMMFGYTRSELLGEPIEGLLPENVRDRHCEHRANYAADPHTRPMGLTMELHGLRKDGSEFPVEISLSPVRVRERFFVSSVIRDVTERKRLESDLIEARRVAERANKANTAFLAAASHDLRQPVQALSLLNGALRRTVSDPLAKEMVESQQLSLDAMTNLLNSLLDISRLDAGKIEPEIENFPIRRLVDRLSGEFARQAAQKGLLFRAEECDAVVRSDPNLLAEIVQNLVQNAIRYTEMGEVSLSFRQGGGVVSLDVSDTGIGIDPSQFEEIFLEFHQCKAPGASNEGFGLGLAIVRRLADLLGHRIDVESSPGHGSRFSVELPLSPLSVTEEAEATGDIGTAHEHGGRIVLVEDDEKVANAWSLLLRSEGYEVASTASVAEVRAWLRHAETAPDLIISDFHLLDGSSGIEAVGTIRDAFTSNTPAFIVSGDTSKVVEAARSLDNSLLMSKPVNTDLLLTLARDAIATGAVAED